MLSVDKNLWLFSFHDDLIKIARDEKQFLPSRFSFFLSFWLPEEVFFAARACLSIRKAKNLWLRDEFSTSGSITFSLLLLLCVFTPRVGKQRNLFRELHLVSMLEGNKLRCWLRFTKKLVGSSWMNEWIMKLASVLSLRLYLNYHLPKCSSVALFAVERDVFHTRLASGWKLKNFCNSASHSLNGIQIEVIYGKSLSTEIW